MKQYYICKPGGDQEGPYPEDMVRTCHEQGIFPADTLIWFDGAAEWMPIQSVFATSGRASSMPSAPESSVSEPEPSAASADISLQTEPTDSPMPTPQSAMPAAPAVTVATPPPYMTTPYPVPPPPPKEEAVYYVAQPGMQPQGPYTRTSVITGYYQGAYPLGSRVWGPDTEGWVPIQQLCHPAGFAYPVGGMPETPAFPWKQPKTWNPITAFTSCMSRYVQFSGRASRSEYWFYLLAFFIVIVGTAVIAGAISGDEDIAEIVCLVTILPFILPCFAVQSRRLHDMGLSAWWLLLCLLPNIGAIILMIISCWGSKNENNPYGTGALPPV